MAALESSFARLCGLEEDIIGFFNLLYDLSVFIGLFE